MKFYANYINLENGETFATDNDDAAEFIRGFRGFVNCGGFVTTSDYEDLDNEAKEVVKLFCEMNEVYVGGDINDFVYGKDSFEEAYEEYISMYPEDADTTFEEYIKACDYKTFEEYLTDCYNYAIGKLIKDNDLKNDEGNGYCEMWELSDIVEEYPEKISDAYSEEDFKEYSVADDIIAKLGENYTCFYTDGTMYFWDKTKWAFDSSELNFVELKK